MKIQTTLSKTDTFRISTKCPSKGNVHVIAIKSDKRPKKRQGPTVGVCFTEVSVKRESTVDFST